MLVVTPLSPPVGTVASVTGITSSSSTIDRLEAAADAATGITFVGASVAPAGPVTVPWRQIHDEARAVAAGLQARGLTPGDHVAMLGPTSRELVTVIRGCWLAGLTSMVLPLPMRMGSLDEFIASTRARIRNGDAKLLLVDDLLRGVYAPAPADPPTESLGAVLPGAAAGAPSGEAYEVPPADPERLVILQYTSGSTSEPKGVMIPDRVLSANIDAVAAAADLASEVMVSWLPLYHDMGLVGFCAIPMTTGVDLVLAAPQDFLAHPGHWMEWISDWRGTATAGPNFSWVLATRALRRASGLDLSSLTLALSGAEPVDPDAVDAFVAAAEPHGFRAGAVFPAFGMAEVAIAGTFPRRGRGLVCDTVDRTVLERDGVAKPVVVDDPDEYAVNVRRLPLLGRAVPGLEMRVVDPDTFEDRPERHVGELILRGTSVTPGYYRRADATAALFHDGWLRTGDLAYLLDGELVLCGRLKDVIIVGGRNVFPEDIERAVAAVDGVRAGNVIALGVEGYKGKESVVVVAEVRVDGDELTRVRADVHHRTLDVCGIPPRDVMLVRPGTLPKTSSGKLQRAKCKEQYLDEALVLA
jgi:fatty-acyl-CoA synthase